MEHGEDPMLAQLRDEIARVHDYLLEGLVLMRDAFDAAGARYTLAYGTLLGAVRDAEMIGWDVDADVHLFVEDEGLAFAELERLADGTRWELERPERAGYEYCFPRLSMRDVPHTVIRVDVFPLVNAPGASGRRRWLYRVFRLLNKLHMLQNMDIAQRTHYSSRRVFLVRAGQRAQRLFPRGLWNRLYRILLDRCRSLESDWLMNPCGSYGDREFFLKSCFSVRRKGRLGSEEFDIPSGAEAYLSQVYGDYLQPPSREAREAEMRFADEHYLRPLRARALLGPDA